jgi:hypothetical protein
VAKPPSKKLSGNTAQNACYELGPGWISPENGTPGAEFSPAFSTIKDDPMPTLTRKPRKAASANRVKQTLLELAYRMHATRAVGVKPVRSSVSK